MRRRDILALSVGAAIAWPLAARAQQKAMPVVGYLSSNSPDAGASAAAAARDGLAETGYVEGRNLAIEYRWAEGHYDRLPELAADLVARKVDVIMANGTPAPGLAAKRATATIPIVFVSGGDPVEDGLVAGLARPGGNITGVSFLISELTPKRLELLSELVPQARIIALLVNPDNPNAERNIVAAQDAARAKGVQLLVVRAATESEIDAVFASLPQLRASGLIIGADTVFAIRRAQLVNLAARKAIATIYFDRMDAKIGGLISYGSNITSAYRLGGTYAGKILDGAKPGDLPVQQPTKFELVINLKTANALGLAVPQSLLQRADEVIE
jgi:putative tryptophan/tyrosine transport system substrate-binding protein